MNAHDEYRSSTSQHEPAAPGAIVPARRPAKLSRRRASSGTGWRPARGAAWRPPPTRRQGSAPAGPPPRSCRPPPARWRPRRRTAGASPCAPPGLATLIPCRRRTGPLGTTMRPRRARCAAGLGVHCWQAIAALRQEHRETDGGSMSAPSSQGLRLQTARLEFGGGAHVWWRRSASEPLSTSGAAASGGQVGSGRVPPVTALWPDASTASAPPAPLGASRQTD